MANSAEPEGPPAARVVVDLLNSCPHAMHPDTLDDPSSARAVLAPFGPVGPIEPVKRVRAALLATLDDDPAAWTALGEATADVAFRMEFAAVAARPVPVAGDPVLGGIVLAVSELVADGLWSRIRVCANDECRKVFYDTTRSRTRRWHSYELCGNRANVAAYRARTTAG